MTGFERWSVWLSAAATAVTGFALFWAKYLLEPPDPWAVVNHPLQPWLLKAHILAAPLLVFALGLIAVRHIWRHYRNGACAGRRSGIVTMLTAGPMIVSGYLIQAVTHPRWLLLLAIAHIGLGTLFVAGLLAHQVFVRRRARREAATVCPRQPIEGDGLRVAAAIGAGGVDEGRGGGSG